MTLERWTRAKNFEMIACGAQDLACCVEIIENSRENDQNPHNFCNTDLFFVNRISN
jgi:hypothetical protein